MAVKREWVLQQVLGLSGEDRAWVMEQVVMASITKAFDSFGAELKKASEEIKKKMEEGIEQPGAGKAEGRGPNHNPEG